MDPDEKGGRRYLRWGDEMDGCIGGRVDGATFIQLPNFHTPPQTPLARSFSPPGGEFPKPCMRPFSVCRPRSVARFIIRGPRLGVPCQHPPLVHVRLGSLAGGGEGGGLRS